ncbi:MAG: hypothetical protein R2688_08150 [Fimbriimonadaceae bacterium]
MSKPPEATAHPSRSLKMIGETGEKPRRDEKRHRRNKRHDRPTYDEVRLALANGKIIRRRDEAHRILAWPTSAAVITGFYDAVNDVNFMSGE